MGDSLSYLDNLLDVTKTGNGERESGNECTAVPA